MFIDTCQRIIVKILKLTWHGTGSFSFSSSSPPFPYFYFFTLDERAVRFSEECQLLSVGLFKFQLIFKSLADNMAEAWSAECRFRRHN